MFGINNYYNLMKIEIIKNNRDKYKNILEKIAENLLKKY